MPSSFTVVYDACVLYPAPMRDLLMELALTDLFRARWSESIHQEWMRSVIKNRLDLSMDALNRTKALMDQSVRDCLVTDYESLIHAINLPDPDDRHVVAAAIRCNASVIVTFNLSDFPDEALAEYGIESQHPDEFVVNLLDLSPLAVCGAVQKLLIRLKKPPMSLDQYLNNLLKQGLPQTVSRLKSGFSIPDIT